MSAVPAPPAVESVALLRALARRLALPFLFVAAAAYHAWQSLGYVTPTVFNDELLYGMSEALAYPVFVGAVAALAHSRGAPSRRTAVVVPFVCVLAIATRVQFLVLPIAYLAAVAVCGNGNYRRHTAPVAAVVALLGLSSASPLTRPVRRCDPAPLFVRKHRSLGADQHVALPVLARADRLRRRAVRCRVDARAPAEHVRTRGGRTDARNDGAGRFAPSARRNPTGSTARTSARRATSRCRSRIRSSAPTSRAGIVRCAGSTSSAAPRRIRSRCR